MDMDHRVLIVLLALWSPVMPEDIRLVGGASRCAGILELAKQGEWEPVQVNVGDLATGAKVCGQLNCGSVVSVRGIRLKGPDVFLNSFFDLSRYKLSVTCSDSVRLVNGTDLCSGRLEVKPYKSWSPVCEKGFDYRDADMVCRKLGCGAPSAFQGGSMEKGLRHLLMGSSVKALQSDSPAQSKYSLRECVLIKDTETDSRLEMTCSVTFTRLVNGTDLCSGRLEVKPYQSWSSVCGDGFDQQDAEVVCRELGCGAPSAFHVGLYGEKAPVWMEEFQCNGNESALLDCRRLVGEAHRCAGELEMKKQGEWRPVVDYISTLNLESAATVCRELGCGSAVSTEETITYLDRPVWWINNLLAQPNISLSPTDGDSKAEQWLVQVLMGSNFTITCSTEPQHQGGTFQLVFTASNRAQNHTLPAVNHSAHFLFYAADHTYQGDYRCVYHIHLFSYNFSSGSPVLYVAVSELIIRSAVLLLSMTLLITALCIASKVSSRRQSTALGKKAEPSHSGVGGSSNDYEIKL
ncbi:hypothetical protein INR49_018350 [Caranx melampygus]|nr:hypothetical protein INR49_018350 [Caranx melampygus]